MESKTAYDYGFVTGRYYRANPRGYWGDLEPSVQEDLGEDILDGDYSEMCRASVEPDCRQYWLGFNAAVEEVMK